MPVMEIRVVSRTLFVLLVALSLSAGTTVTVCASGCSYSDFKDAIANAPNGVSSTDPTIIELRAGENFDGYEFTFAAKKNITVRTSAWRQLPPPGTRIDPVTHSALLANIRSSINGTTPILIGQQEGVMQSVNTSTDQITFYYSVTPIAEGQQVVCGRRKEYSVEASWATQMPAPLQHAGIYYAKSVSNSSGVVTTQLSTSPGGSAIDITTAGAAGSSTFYEQPFCMPSSPPENITFQGVRIQHGPSVTDNSHGLIKVGTGSEALRDWNAPRNIAFRHVVVTGKPFELLGPVYGIYMPGVNGAEVTDSWIGWCRSSAGGTESKGVWIANSSNVTVRNNYIMAASLNLGTSGVWDVTEGRVPDNLIFEFNYLDKPGDFLYQEGAGAPTHSCFYGGAGPAASGAFYLNTSSSGDCTTSGRCYKCQANGAWAITTSAADFRDHDSYVKNHFECKGCENVRFYGNYSDVSAVSSDTGQGWTSGYAPLLNPAGTPGGNGPWVKIYNVYHGYNRSDNSYRGISLSNGAYAPATWAQVPSSNVLVEHNIVTGMGNNAKLSRFFSGTTEPFSLKVTTGARTLTVRNNTFRQDPAGTMYAGVWWFPDQWPDHAGAGSRIMDGFRLQNNIIAGYGDATNGQRLVYIVSNSNVTVAADCTSNGMSKLLAAQGLHNNVFTGYTTLSWFGDSPCDTYATKRAVHATESGIGFTSATDASLTTSSAYSGRNGSASFTSVGEAAVNGSDLGADTVEVMRLTEAARLGVRPFQVAVVPGSTQASLTFSRPANTACTVTIHTNASRAAEHADTSTSGDKQSDRSSSIASGSVVTFAAGKVAALTASTLYWWTVDCGTDQYRARGTFRTSASGSGQTYAFEAAHSTAATLRLEYSSSSDFSSPTTVDRPFAGGRAVVSSVLPSGTSYTRLKYLDGSNNVLVQGPARTVTNP